MLQWDSYEATEVAQAVSAIGADKSDSTGSHKMCIDHMLTSALMPTQ